MNVSTEYNFFKILFYPLYKLWEFIISGDTIDSKVYRKYFFYPDEKIELIQIDSSLINFKGKVITNKNGLLKLINEENNHLYCIQIKKGIKILIYQNNKKYKFTY